MTLPEKTVETKTELAKEPAKDAPKTTAPEKYEAFKLPEGFTLPEAKLAKAHEVFKGLGLDQAGAQALIDFHTAEIAEVAGAGDKEYSTMRETWRDAVKADPEIGSKLEAVKQTVSKALDSLGDPALAKDFRAAMDLTGAGDNPAFIKTFYKLAQKLTEGTSVQGGGPTKVTAPDAKPISAAAALYPNLKP